MAYYPIVLELAGRPCLLVGGGSVAERKVEGLLTADAGVTVISLALTSRLEQWVRSGQVHHVARTYCPGDLAGFQLVFAVTGDEEVNAAVYREARERGVWVNTADDPAHCDFTLPAIVRRSDLVVAVATGGTSPALTRVIRDELEAFFSADYAILAEVAAKVRRELRARGCFSSGERWRNALKDGVFRRFIQEGRREEATARLLEQLGE